MNSANRTTQLYRINHTGGDFSMEDMIADEELQEKPIKLRNERSANCATADGSKKKIATDSSSEAAIVVQARGPVNSTFSSSVLMATLADHNNARIPRPNVSHSMLMPRTNGHCPQELV